MFISDAIKYVGCDDDDLDLFEGQLVLEHGVSYNSYVILDEKIAIFDAVDDRCTEQYLANLAEALGNRQPDYLIVQHMEPDHSGSLGAVLNAYPNVTIVSGALAFNMMKQFAVPTEGHEKLVIKEGDTLSLGAHTLQFIAAPMVHWPEVMMSYEQSEKVLFCADAFGKFGSLSYDDPEGWTCEARRYYFNIVGRYGAQVQALLKKAAGLEITKLLPLHGPVLDEDLGKYIKLYDTWSSYEPEESGILVVCASIHGNTLAAAEELVEMLKAVTDTKVKLVDITREDWAETVEDAFRYDRMICCACTYDTGLFPPMHSFIHHLASKGFCKRKIGLVENGSWAPKAGSIMKAMFEEMENIEIVAPMVTIKSSLTDDNRIAMKALANAMK